MRVVNVFSGTHVSGANKQAERDAGRVPQLAPLRLSATPAAMRASAAIAAPSSAARSPTRFRRSAPRPTTTDHDPDARKEQNGDAEESGGSHRNNCSNRCAKPAILPVAHTRLHDEVTFELDSLSSQGVVDSLPARFGMAFTKSERSGSKPRGILHAESRDVSRTTPYASVTAARRSPSVD